MRSLNKALPVLALLIATGCASRDEGASEDDLSVESTKIPSFVETVQAGDSFFPFGDSAPLQTGDTPCIEEPRVRMSSLMTELSGSVVYSRLDMTAKLDLGGEGVPFKMKKIVGSALGGLALSTEFSQESVTLLFQVVGRYSTELSGAKQIHRFSPADISRCGLGYVTRSEHRMGAVVAVTLRSRTIGGKASLNLSGTVGPANAKAAIEAALKAGAYDVTVRAVTEGLTDVASLPLGGFATISSVPEENERPEPSAAMKGIEEALNWLGGVPNSMRIPSDPQGHAPVTSVSFKYYPQTPSDLRNSLGHAYDGVLATRAARGENYFLQRRWEDAERALERGTAHQYNTRTNPVRTVGDLQARLQQAIHSGDSPIAKLEEALAATDGECGRAISNSDELTDVADIIDALKVCQTPVPQLDMTGVDLAELQIRFAKEENFREDSCPSGTRRPKTTEVTFFSPFSRANGEMGIWLDPRSSSSYSWYLNGNIDDMYFNRKGVTLCVPEGGIF